MAHAESARCVTPQSSEAKLGRTSADNAPAVRRLDVRPVEGRPERLGEAVVNQGQQAPVVGLQAEEDVVPEVAPSRGETRSQLRCRLRLRGRGMKRAHGLTSRCRKPREWTNASRSTSCAPTRRTVSSSTGRPRRVRTAVATLGPRRSVTRRAQSVHWALAAWGGAGDGAREWEGETGAEAVTGALRGSETTDQPRNLGTGRARQRGRSACEGSGRGAREGKAVRTAACRRRLRAC